MKSALQGQIQNVQLEEKMSSRKYKQIKEKLDSKRNKVSSDLRAIHHPVKLQICEKELKKCKR